MYLQPPELLYHWPGIFAKKVLLLDWASYFRWIVSNLVEKKIGLLSEKDEFSLGSASGKDSLWPNDPMPGKKSPAFRGTKKGDDPSFPEAGFRRFSLVMPLHPRPFAETKRGRLGRFLPALFAFGACFLARATRKGV